MTDDDRRLLLQLAEKIDHAYTNDPSMCVRLVHLLRRCAAHPVGRATIRDDLGAFLVFDGPLDLVSGMKFDLHITDEETREQPDTDAIPAVRSSMPLS